MALSRAERRSRGDRDPREDERWPAPPGIMGAGFTEGMQTEVGELSGDE